MADDRTDIPGSGEIEGEERREGAPPPSPQGASYETQTPPEPEGSTRSWWPVCLILGIGGCGCLLVVLLALGIIGGVSWSLLGGEPEQAPVNGAPQTLPPEEPEPPSPPSVEAPTETPTPGENAAMQWARDRRPDWEAAVDDHSNDWRWVQLVMSPSASDEWTTWVQIQWNAEAGRYDLIDEGPLGVEEPLPEDVPELYRPGEEVAKEAALGYVEEPDWVARVDSHSEDWRRATVSVGPPASEFVWVVSLQWNDQGDYYDLISVDDVDYPGME